MDGLNPQYLISHSAFVHHYTKGEFWGLDEFFGVTIQMKLL